MERATRSWHCAMDRAAMQRFLAQESSSAGRRLASFAINPGWPEENLEQKFLDTAKKLAHFGWTIPPQMIPRELFELSTSSDGETVDVDNSNNSLGIIW